MGRHLVRPGNHGHRVRASNTATEAASDAQGSAEISLAYTDASGLFTPEQAAAFGAAPTTSPQEGIEAVRTGAVEAYFDFPADPASTEVKAYGADQGLFENNKYSAVAKAMLNEAVNARVGSDALATLAAGDAAVDVTTFKDGKETGGINAAIPPLLFLVLFYALIILLAGQMLSSTLEEKENRVTEMILTTVKPTTLISGKVLALFGIGLVQMLIFVSPSSSPTSSSGTRSRFPTSTSQPWFLTRSQ